MAALKPLTEGGRLTAALASQISDGAAALLVAPIPATAHALRVTGMSIGDFDVIEVNEAFASVVPAWLKETGADPARVNTNGGAIALGHPLGATGAVLAVKLLHKLERTGGGYGLQVMCEGGGQANVTVIERLAGTSRPATCPGPSTVNRPRPAGEHVARLLASRAPLRPWPWAPESGTG